MRVINRHYTDIGNGFAHILELNQRVEREWRSRIGQLEQARRNQEEYQRQVAEYQSQKTEIEHDQADLRLWNVGKQILFGIGLAVGWTPVGLAGGLVCTVVSTIKEENLNHKLAQFQPPPAAPGALPASRPLSHPSHPSPKWRYKTLQRAATVKKFDSIDLDLLEEWWRQLSYEPSSVCNPVRHHTGEDGERRLLDHMRWILPHEVLAIPGALIRKKSDADLIVLKPSGIWVLESKYDRGTITYRNGSWKHTKEFYDQGGSLVVQDRPINVPSAQWLAQQKAIYITLNRSHPRQERTVRGGLAFTHPYSHLQIDSDCPVEAGTISHWEECIGKPEEPVFSQMEMLRDVDLILRRSHQLEADQTVSAVDLAESVYQAKIAELTCWQLKAG